MANRLLLMVWLLMAGIVHAQKKKEKPEYYTIRVYHFTTAAQETILDTYLEKALMPALHKAGIQQVGVFKSLANDTAADKTLYLFFAAPLLEKLAALPQAIQKDTAYTHLAGAYLEAAYDQPPFTRMETILLRAFRLAPQMKLPALKNARPERIYELRSYESATEKLYNSKVTMFNEGGEISLFARLGFNAVFYAGVISGSRMPNLMYMTSFENKTERDAHWKTFGSDPEWKRLSALPEYQHTVSKADIILLHATAYSDF